MERDCACLLDILSSARMIRACIQGIDLDKFLHDTKLQDSVIRHLVQIVDN